LLTANTITDEQIRELRSSLADEHNARMAVKPLTYDENARYIAAQYQTSVALGIRRARRGWSRAKARARCAEILNARAKQP
jgi:hypothetical protein